MNFCIKRIQTKREISPQFIISLQWIDTFEIREQNNIIGIVSIIQTRVQIRSVNKAKKMERRNFHCQLSSVVNIRTYEWIGLRCLNAMSHRKNKKIAAESSLRVFCLM